MSSHSWSVRSLVRYSLPPNVRRVGTFLDWQHGPYTPHSFDRVVSDWQHYDTSSRLFSLPVEIIDNITQYLAADSDSALALVNRTALQLVRSLRFADIWLDYSPRAHAFLAALSREAEERTRNDGKLALPSLGCCVKRLFICTIVDNIEKKHRVDLLSSSARHADVNDAYFRQYLPTIEIAIARALPNLDVVAWEDATIHMEPYLLSLMQSPIRRLSLRRVSMDQGIFTEPCQLFFYCRMQLRYLLVEVPLVDSGRQAPAVSVMCGHLLRMSAETLEEVVLDGCQLRLTKPEYAIQTTNLDTMPPLRLVHLKKLTLISTQLSEYEDLYALFGKRHQSKLALIEADTEANSATRDFFRNRGTIPTLRIFVWTTQNIVNKYQLNFLQHNPQLRKLSIRNSISADLLTETLLPMLSTSFHNLISLDIYFTEAQIPYTAVAAICTIPQLQMLRLSAGDLNRQRQRWLPNHTTMQSLLAGMPHLRKLALHRDYYLPGGSDTPTDIGTYYSRQLINPQNEEEQHLLRITPFEENNPDANAPDDNPGFQRVHTLRMANEAMAYARALPQLDWIYLGQRHFTFARRSNGAQPIIVDRILRRLSPREMRMFTAEGN